MRGDSYCSRFYCSSLVFIAIHISILFVYCRIDGNTTIYALNSSSSACKCERGNKNILVNWYYNLYHIKSSELQLWCLHHHNFLFCIYEFIFLPQISRKFLSFSFSIWCLWGEKRFHFSSHINSLQFCSIIEILNEFIAQTISCMNAKLITYQLKTLSKCCSITLCKNCENIKEWKVHINFFFSLFLFQMIEKVFFSSNFLFL